MGRLRSKLEEIKAKGQKALVSYMMVGYPDLQTSLEIFKVLLENGTDILEIGLPFSDPVADGPVIQQAHEVALRNGIKSEDVFEVSMTLRKEFPNTPFLLMTYYNPIFKIGMEKFCHKAAESGIDGFIVPDLPPEEASTLKESVQKYGLSLVFLASPTSTERRIKLICENSDHMVYFVSITGTTGEREKLPIERLSKDLVRYRNVCDKDVVVGFGVSKYEQAKQITEIANGIVVGSAFVKLAGNRDLKGISEKVKELKLALM